MTPSAIFLLMIGFVQLLREVLRLGLSHSQLAFATADPNRVPKTGVKAVGAPTRTGVRVGAGVRPSGDRGVRRVAIRVDRRKGMTFAKAFATAFLVGVAIFVGKSTTFASASRAALALACAARVASPAREASNVAAGLEIKAD